MNPQPNTPASLNEAVAHRSLAEWRRLYDNRPESVLRGQHFTEFVAVGRYFEALAAPGAAIDAREQGSPELLLGWKRYEKARKLSPFQWNRLHIRNLAGENFDAMIDSLPEPTTPVPTPDEALSPATVAQPVGYVNGDELDNMLDDRTAVIQGTRSGFRNTPLFAAAQPCASQGCGGTVSDEQLTDVIQIVRNIFGGHSVSRNAPHWKAVNDQARASIRAALSTAPRSLDGATPGGNDHG